MNLLDALRKVFFNFMNNCRVSIGGDEVSVKYNDGASNHEFKAISDGEHMSIHYDSSDTSPCLTDSAKYSCVGCCICNLFGLFGGVYTVSLIVRNESDADCTGFFEKTFREDNITISSVAEKLKLVTSLASDKEDLDTIFITIGGGNAYAMVKTISVKTFNNWFSNKSIPDASCNHDFYKEVEQLLSTNPANIPNNAGLSVIAGLHELINYIDANHGDDPFSNDPCNMGYGAEADIAILIAKEFLDMELLRTGRAVKDVCKLSYSPEIPFIKYDDEKKIKEMRKKYKEIFTNETSDIIKIPLLENKENL